MQVATPSLGWLKAMPQPHTLTARLNRRSTAELLTDDADVSPETNSFAERDTMLKVGGCVPNLPLEIPQGFSCTVYP